MEKIPKTPSPKLSPKSGSKGTPPSQIEHYKAPSKSVILGKYKPVKLITNIFDIFKNRKDFIYQYPLKFEPPVQDDSRELIQEILQANKRNMTQMIGSFIDSGLCIFAFRQIEGASVSFDGHDSHKLLLEEKNMRKIDMNSFVNFSENDESSGSEEMIQTGVSQPQHEIIRILNIMIKNKLRDFKYREFGLQKSYFNFSLDVLTRSGTFRIFKGYKTSIGCYQGYKLKILIDYCVKIIRKETLWDEITQLKMDFQDQRGKNEQEALNMAMEELVCDKYCLADYGNKRIYKLSGYDMTMSPMSDFPENDKGYKTYYDYFLANYKYKIKDRKQPLVFSIQRRKVTKKGHKKPVWEENILHFVPEMLRATGMTDQQRANYRVMTELAEHTKLDPKQRMNFIYKHAELLDQNPEQKMKGEGKQTSRRNIDLKIDVNSNEIQGLQLPYPKIELGDNKSAQLSEKWGGNFVVNSKLYQKPDIKNWAIVYQEFEVKNFGGGRGRGRGGRGGNNNQGSNFMFHERIFEEFKNNSKNLGIKLSKPKMFKKGRDIKIEELKGILDKAKKNDCQIVVFMLSDYLLNKSKFYNKLKNYSLELGVKTQFIKLDTKTITKRGFTDNILIQIISKCGYAPWRISNYPYLKEVGNGRTRAPKVCLIGLDVCHMKGNKSLVAMSSTTTDDFTGIYNDILVQGENYKDKFSKKTNKEGKNRNFKSEEIISGVGKMVVQAIKEYARRNNGVEPTNVIIYRDGVGDSQINEVNIKEVNSIRDHITTSFPEKTIELTVILVTKRLNERFFKSDIGGILTNPINGLVVDSQVVSDNFFEWFMVAQNVTQGTATPTKFRIIYNDNEEIPSDYFYNLTYYTTYLFYNWKGPIRVPMVCQNAHTLAFLASQTRTTQICEEIKRSNYHL